MVNVSLSKFRKQHTLHPVADMGLYDSLQVPEDVFAKIGAEELLALICELPPRYRMVFNLFVMEGMNHQEISEAMGITVGTSKSNLARARDFLKRGIQILYSEVGTNANYSA
jgi:RNA polymerase sigma factor (sigma-70 family)